MNLQFLRFISCLLLIYIPCASVWAQDEQSKNQQEELVVENGRQVAIELLVVADDGETHLNNRDKAPLIYNHGENALFPALEKALTGLKVNESKTVELTALEAFGMSDPNAFIEVSLDTIPEEARTVGMIMQIDDRDGNPRMIRIHEINADNAVLDFNHPLAGKGLTVTVRVLAIE